MVVLKKILLPVDLSHISPTVAPYAKLLAQRMGAELHILSVVRPIDELSADYVPADTIERAQAELNRGFEKRMREFVESSFSDCPVARSVVVAGHPVEEILKYARSEGIDMLIMGTHGRKGMEKAIFGSVVERIILSCPLPVLVVNPYKNRIEVSEEEKTAV